MNRFLCSLLLIFTYVISEAQVNTKSDTIYYRYDDSVGSVERSNYYAVRTKMDDGTMDIKEYYRFTKPHRLKSSFTEIAPNIKQGAYAYYAKDGFIEEEGFYKNNEKEGEIIFYETGQIQRKVPYVNGKQDGVARYFHGGKKIFEWTWKDGKSDGYNESTYDNGNIKFRGTYVNGNLEGESSQYYENGNLTNTSFYHDGRYNGKKSFYHENGSLLGEGEYVNGNSTGIWKWYREDGTIASEEFYKKGKLKKIRYFDSSGIELSARKKDLVTGVLDDSKALRKKIKKHMTSDYNYPEILRSNGYEARVYLSFVIDKTGVVKDVKATSNAHLSFDLEAKNLILSLPKQEPAYEHNILREAHYKFPLVFKID